MAAAGSKTIVPSAYLAALLTLSGMARMRRRPLAALVDLGTAAAAIRGISDHTVDRMAGMGGLLVAVRDLRAARGSGAPARRLVPALAVGVLGLAAATGTTLVLDPDG